MNTPQTEEQMIAALSESIALDRSKRAYELGQALALANREIEQLRRDVAAELQASRAIELIGELSPRNTDAEFRAAVGEILRAVRGGA